MLYMVFVTGDAFTQWPGPARNSKNKNDKDGQPKSRILYIFLFL